MFLGRSLLATGALGGGAAFRALAARALAVRLARLTGGFAAIRRPVGARASGLLALLLGCHESPRTASLRKKRTTTLHRGMRSLAHGSIRRTAPSTHA